MNVQNTLRTTCLLSSLLTLSCSNAPSTAAFDSSEDSLLPSARWPAWRGEDAGGQAAGGAYPAKFGAEKNLVWKVEIPGRGYSTPVLWDGHILVTTGASGENRVLDLDSDGKTRWSTPIGTERAGKHRNGSGSNPSAVTDGKGIFVYFKSGDLAGLDFDGNVLWSTNLQVRFAQDTLYWDVGTSPVLTRRHVIATVQHQGNSYLAAFDKLTGELGWKVARDYDCQPEGDHSYTTPLVVKRGEEETLLVWGAEHVTAHSVIDGTLLWSCAGFNPEKIKNWVTVASPVLAGEILVVPYGRGTHLAGVALGGKGDVTSTHRRWTRTDTGTFVPTPAIADGSVYLVGDKGEVSQLDPVTGTTLAATVLPKHRAKYYSSPLIADRKLYAAREDGVVMVLSLGSELSLLAENDLGERVIASPVAVAGRLFVRSEKHLFCFSTESAVLAGS